MTYYVDISTFRSGNGSKDYPFRTISEAAKVAKAGDTVLVAPGVYREWVNPVNAGTPDAPITYKSTEPLAAHITGAETVSNWTKVDGTTWVTRIGNGLFGDFNPYTAKIEGDWFMANVMTAHRGDVYLNEKSMYEVLSLEDCKKGEVYEESWDKPFSVYKWYTEQDTEKNETVIYANFQDKDPTKENVEIAVRPACFYPKAEGIGYITFSGFTVSKAATNWAPPTAYQEGMIGPHWSKGWVIEDCHIYESKCCGISLGKYLQPYNDNKWLHRKYKDGTQTERENVCQAQLEGWTKEKIGSHIVRHCNIHNCGQCGIVGHLGGVFSIIEDNHIHHINNKQNLAGAEIGGIKMHAAIDVIFRRNHIHDCTRGIWLDWQAQGTRVTQNLFYNNVIPYVKPGDKGGFMGTGQDLQVEVSHGPTLIDHNFFLSDYALHLPSQGHAVVHNFIGGSITAVGIGTNNGAKTLNSPRYTPYHVPHGTGIVGFMTFLHGDSRYYNNIFVQMEEREPLASMVEHLKGNDWQDGNLDVGTIPFENYPTFEEWDAQFEGYCGMGSEPSDRYYDKLPVWAAGNVYFNGAQPMSKEKDAIVDSEHKVTWSVTEKDGSWEFKTNAFDLVKGLKKPLISTETLGEAFEPEQKFENPDGSPIVFNEDYFGNHRADTATPGPVENGEATMRI